MFFIIGLIQQDTSQMHGFKHVIVFSGMLIIGFVLTYHLNQN